MYNLYTNTIKYKRFIIIIFIITLFSFFTSIPTFAGGLGTSNHLNGGSSSSNNSGLSEEEISERLNSRPDEPSLLKIYNTSMMRGSWKWIQKFSFLGTATNILISFVGLASNCSLLARQTITIMYLSNRAHWDRVHDLKETRGQGGFGVDAIIQRMWALGPDIKDWSDWNSRSGIKLTDDDDVWTFIIKSAPSSVGIVLISTMAYNGTLGRVWANFADGFGTVAEVFTTINLGDKIQNIITKEQGYRFTYEDGSYVGKFKQKLAEAIYRKVSSEAQLHDTVQFNKLGAGIESWIETNVSSSGNTYGLSFNFTDSEFNGDSEDGYNYIVRDNNEVAYQDYKITTIVNSNPGPLTIQPLDGGAPITVNGFRLKDFNGSLSEDFDQYVYIVIRK